MQAELMRRCEGIEGAALGEGAFSPGPAIWVGRREVAHFDDEQSLDVRLTRQVIRNRRAELKQDPRVTLRGSSSDWLEFEIGSAADLDDAFQLVVDAVAANESTAPPGPPPDGEDLARRRRFH